MAQAFNVFAVDGPEANRLRQMFGEEGTKDYDKMLARINDTALGDKT